jgi:hypothetical protein
METKLQLLPVAERIKLVEDLWDSIAADQGGLGIPLNIAFSPLPPLLATVKNSLASAPARAP